MPGRLAKIAVVAACALTPAAFAGAPPPPLVCDVGPVEKVYGGTDWFVLSCTDRRTVIVYSMPDNPASPYYFIWMPQRRGGSRLEGHGVGNRKSADAALKELRAMSDKAVAALIKETEATVTGSVR